jgi:hypothetical protein
MQAVALVTGDEFMTDYNLTIDTDDVFDFIKKLIWDWRTAEYNFCFNDVYGIDFAEIVGPTGFCYNFNLIQSEDLYNLELLPDVFNYSKDIYHNKQVFKYRTLAMDPDDFYPKYITDSRSGLFSIIHQGEYKKPFDYNHHEKYAAQGANYLIHSPFEMISKASTHHQSIVNHSMIIYLSPQKTIIDEALQSYPPERFDIDVKENTN